MQTAYVKVPKHIMSNKSISSDAKLIYFFLLDRLSLSQKNGWKDEQGRTYIIFPLSEIMEILNCSKPKASNVLSELEGFIEKKRRGFCKPDIIYIKPEHINQSAENDSAEIFNNVCHTETPEVTQTEHLNTTIQNSGGKTAQTQEFTADNPNNNNINKNNINKNNFNNPSSFNPYEWIEERNDYTKILKDNINYSYFKETADQCIVDDIVNIAVNTICSKKDFVRISGEDIPHIEVKKRLLTLNQYHIEHICDCFKKNKSKVNNMQAYLLTSVYRSHDVLNTYYFNLVKSET